MQSHIKIKMHFKCIIGILDFEREKKQKINIKLEVKSDDFLDYSLLCEWIKKIYKKNKFHLLEDSVRFILENIKDFDNNINYIKIKISKPNIIKNAKVSIKDSKIFK